jgi:hypothetical protein
MKGQLLQEWFNDNMPDEKQWIFGKAAQNQIVWVRDNLGWMIGHGLKLEPYFNSPDEWRALITVDGTHTSKSVLLPVYRFEHNGIVIKIRANFHDWCVRCWTPLKKPFPPYLLEAMHKGYYEGMEGENSPIEFCVSSREELFAVLWWMLSEGLSEEND